MIDSNQVPEFQHKFLPPRDSEIGYTLVLLHGTGGSESDLLPLADRIFPEAAVISPRGKVSENGMARYFKRIEPGVFDTESLIKETNELADFLLNASERYNINPDKFIAVGYSNGANIAASMMLLRPGIFRAAILYRPMVPLCPAKKPNLDGVNILVCAAKLDEIVAPEEPIRLAELLHESKGTVSLHWSESGHGLDKSDIEASQQWVRSKFENGSL